MKISPGNSFRHPSNILGKRQRKAVVIAVIEVGCEPNSLALSDRDSTVWVCNALDSTLSVIDTTAHQVVAVIRLPIQPLAMVIDRSGRRGYVTGLGKPLLMVIDIAARRVIGRIISGEGHALAINAEGTRVYVNANSPAKCRICVIDTASASMIDSIETGSFTSAAVLAAHGRLFYCDYIHHALKVLDTDTGEITTALSLPAPLEEIAIVAAQDVGYLPYRTSDGIVAKIDLTSYDVVDLLPAPALPHGLIINPNGDLACCCSASERRLTIIDTATWQVVSRFQAGEYPQGPAFSADGSRLYVCDASGDTVWVVALD